MIYNDFKGLKLSALGMGNMRLPTLDGDDSRIDEAATEQILDYCMTLSLIHISPTATKCCAHLPTASPACITAFTARARIR